MEIYKSKFKIKVIWIIVILIILALILLTIYYINADHNSVKITGILSGLITGLVIALFQIFLDWYGFRQIEELKELKIISVNTHRDERISYQNQIQESKNTIDIMGVTADRLLDHFADTTTNSREESKVLIRALEKGVKIRFLLPSQDYLEINDREKYDKVLQKLIFLKENHSNLEYRYFKHTPAHSIFRVDESCIIGPVFPRLSSKNTPAIHFKIDSPYANKYLDHFNDEWEKSK